MPRVTTDRDLLVQASRLYYELGETQNAVADRLGVTRPQVSRLLKRARAEGIVEIRIVDRDTAESPAADSLRGRFKLEAVHLAPTLAGPEDLTRRIVGRLAAQVLRASIRDGAIVGIGDGASVGAVADALDDAATPVRATIVPARRRLLVDRSGARPVPAHRRRVRGTTHGLMAPGLLDDAATKRALEAHAGVRAVIDLWERLDVALFGIGGRSWSAASLGPDVAASLDHAHAVGEILIAPFDADGAFVCPALRDRVLAFDARGLREVPVSIGVGSGARKVAPILGALRSGAVKTLVTDVETAEAVVREADTHMTTPTTAILGIDLGTTEVKAGLVGLDGRLLAIARGGYGLTSGTARAGRSRTPGRGGRRWSSRSGHCARPSRSRSWRSASTATARRSRRRRHGGATRPAITFLDTRADRRGRRARGCDRDPRLGARAAARGALAGAPRARGRRADALVPDDLGVARVPADRRGRARRWRPVRRRRTRTASGGDRAPDGSTSPIAAMGDIVGRLTRRAATPSVCGPASRSRAAPTTLRELSRRRSARGGRCVRPGRLGRRVRRVLGRPVEVAGAFVTPAPARPVQRRGRDGRHGTSARLVPRRDRRRRLEHRVAARGGRDMAGVPVVTMLGLDVGIALGGAIFTESVFGLPGLGRLAVQGSHVRPADDPGRRRLRDARIIVFNLMVDLVYAFHRSADPSQPDGAARGRQPQDVRSRRTTGS